MEGDFQQEPEHLWTVDDLAKFMKLKPYTIRQWARTGRDSMPVIRTGRVIRFDRERITKWLRRFEA